MMAASRIRKLSDAGELLRPWPANLRETDRQTFAGDLHFSYGAASATLVEDAVFAARGELFAGGDIVPEYFPENDSARQPAREQLLARMRRAQAEARIYRGEWLWVTDRLSANYYHWLCDCLPRLEAWLAQGHSGRLLLPRLVLDQPFVRASLEAYPEFEIADPPSEGQGGRVERAWVAVPLIANGNHHERFLDRAARRLRQHFGGDAGGDGPRLWISRAQAGKRRVSNENEINPVLRRHGYLSVAMENLPLARQVQLSAAASAIAGPHGAGLANLVFMRAGGNLIELRQMDGVPNFFFTLAAARKQTYLYVPCRATIPGHPAHAADIVCPPDELDAALAAAGR